MPICVASTSVSVISQTPWNTACRSWHDVPVRFQNPAWQAQTDTAVSLWVSRSKYQFHLWSSSWPFCSDSPEWHSRHMVTWFGRHGDDFGMTENAFFRVFITLRSQFHLHHCSQRALMEIVSKITTPWTCPLSAYRIFKAFFPMYIISRLGQLVHTTHTYTHISQDNGVEDKVFWRRKKGFETARQTKQSWGLYSASKYKLSCKAHACVLFLSGDKMRKIINFFLNLHDSLIIIYKL